MRPPAPEWLLEVGLNKNNLVAVHTGDCWGVGKRAWPVTRAEALRRGPGRRAGRWPRGRDRGIGSG
ncbi:DUF6233 domain-containing protein [Streptomyces spiralis]|nr:DUF6233 domain-containing protein [Streptomyces spiralis]